MNGKLVEIGDTIIWTPLNSGYLRKSIVRNISILFENGPRFRRNNWRENFRILKVNNEGKRLSD